MNVGWLSTGRDPAARILLSETVHRAADDGLPLNIGAVFCDREIGEADESDLFLDLVDRLGLRAVTRSSDASWETFRAGDGLVAGSGASVGLDVTAGAGAAAGLGDAERAREAWRAEFHRDVMNDLEPLGLDLLVLAGYMLVVSPEMCSRYAMLNLHPALPGGPTGTWQEVIWKLLRGGATETGAMVHLVTAELDRGPAIAYCSFPIAGPELDPLWRHLQSKVRKTSLEDVARREGEAEPLFAEIRRRGEVREIPLLYQTVRQFVLGELRIEGGRVAGGGVGGHPAAPLPVCLNDQVEADLAARGRDAP